ncbi:MAG: hypothetical protein ABWZ57_05115 [Mesorhizobium sp.]
MGSILSFTPRQAAKPRAAEDGTAAAAVIIFPGVRYERTGEPAKAPPPKDPPNAPSPVKH